MKTPRRINGSKPRRLQGRHIGLCRRPFPHFRWTPQAKALRKQCDVIGVVGKSSDRLVRLTSVSWASCLHSWISAIVALASIAPTSASCKAICRASPRSPLPIVTSRIWHRSIPSSHVRRARQCAPASSANHGMSNPQHCPNTTQHRKYKQVPDNTVRNIESSSNICTKQRFRGNSGDNHINTTPGTTRTDTDLRRLGQAHVNTNSATAIWSDTGNSLSDHRPIGDT